jgi:hypothetical protein
MGTLRRLAFFVGLILGLATTALAGAVALTYLFTGKFPSVEVAEGRAEVQLMAPDEVAGMVREQVAKVKAAQGDEIQGGEGDDEA